MGRKLAWVPDALKMKGELIYRITTFPRSFRELILEGSLGPASSVTTRTFKESTMCTLAKGQEQTHTSVQALKQRTFQQLRSFYPQIFLETQGKAKYCTVEIGVLGFASPTPRSPG